ncbi:hypothetical protein [Carboxylicivirga sp. N1Y90]|uniref:hypothetical protein n=1 Tax=Carboxylicivirga fragile TaxID=3417571 RepID=UPI003D32EF30|nr:hypothetical protein [Marinilabiliaceae bacterium N1Y90]
MDNYIKQLIESINQSKNKHDSKLAHDEPDYINEFADQYINGTPEKISKLTGIEKYQFPPSDKLNKEQITNVVKAIEQLLLSFNLEFIFPEDVTCEVKYDFIVKKWDSKHIHCKDGTVQIETCKFDDDNCPFPEQCTICENFKDENDSKHALANGEIDFENLMPDFNEQDDANIRSEVDRFKELMRKKSCDSYITGIHNYCDGRCHRCAFTDKCSSFSLNQELERSNDESEDGDSDKQLMVILKATSEIIEEELTKRGIDAEEKLIELKQDDEVPSSPKHTVELQSESYAEKVKRWLDSNQRELESRIVTEEEDEIQSYFESITWFQLFIPAKISRAAMVLQSDEPGESEIYDSNGSAKIALLAMDESIWAWQNLLQHLTKKEDSILNILKHLSKLRSESEALFPEARKFIRPGFDANI